MDNWVAANEEHARAYGIDLRPEPIEVRKATVCTKN
jgi:hypothetical protein